MIDNYDNYSYSVCSCVDGDVEGDGDGGSLYVSSLSVGSVMG